MNEQGSSTAWTGVERVSAPFAPPVPGGGEPEGSRGPGHPVDAPVADCPDREGEKRFPRRAHNPETAGSTPVFATSDLLFFAPWRFDQAAGPPLSARIIDSMGLAVAYVRPDAAWLVRGAPALLAAAELALETSETGDMAALRSVVEVVRAGGKSGG